MEDTKKLDEAAKSEEIVEPVERVELTDEQLNQVSGGFVFCTASGACTIAAGKDGIAPDKAHATAVVWSD